VVFLFDWSNALAELGSHSPRLPLQKMLYILTKICYNKHRKAVYI